MKIRKLLIAVLVSFMMFGYMNVEVFAQNSSKELILNDSTETNEYLPFYCAEFNFPQHCQFIQPAETLIEMKGGKISKMSFYVSSGEGSDANLSLRLLETDSTTFSDDFLATADSKLVFTGATSINEGKLVINFDESFEYSGKNLLLDFTFNDLPTNNSTTLFYGENVLSNVGRTQCGLDVLENLSFLPKICFEYTINSSYLDLEDSITYPSEITVEQNYSFTQDSEEYIDVTKVKVEWTTSDILATYKSSKTWDPDSLTWIETKKEVSVDDKTASFKLTNYSSKKVTGTISFEAEKALKETLTSITFDENNGVSIDTVVNGDHTIDEAKKANLPSNTINATLNFNKEKFAQLSAKEGSNIYGTYTITIK